MSHKGNTETFYREIIAKVTEKMKEEYNNEGIGEDTLLLMKKKWEEKMTACGIFEAKPNQQSSYLQKFGRNQYCIPGFNNNEIKSAVPFSTFKSTPNNTTSDNIQSYLESRKINNPILQPHSQQINQPKFFTSTQQPTNFNTQNGTDINNQSNPHDFRREFDQARDKKIASNLPLIKKEEKVEEDDKEDKKSDDSDFALFKKQKEEGNKDNRDPNKNEEDDESLSPLSSESGDHETETKDFLLAQYEKVHRVRNKWKVTFKDAVLHNNGKEYVFDRVVGELDRDW